MNTTLTIADKIEVEITRAALLEAGEYMDAVEGGDLPMDAKRYLESATLANKLLREQSAALIDLCECSWALTDIQKDIELDARISSNMIPSFF